MRNHMRVLRLLVWSILLAVVWLGRAGPAAAQTGGDYALTWSTVDGGGVTMAEGGAYALASTAGQPDAGRLSGDDYVLHGGFWPGGGAVGVEHHLYLPLVVRG